MGWAFPVVDYISFLRILSWFFWIHEQRLDGSSTFKKTLTLYFTRVCLYCSLRPLMCDMTTIAPSINFPVDGFDILLVFCWGLPC